MTMEFLNRSLDIYGNDEIVLCQDDISLGKKEFISLCNTAKDNAKQNLSQCKDVYIVSDNSVRGLAAVIGLVAAGINVLPLNTFNNGYMNDYLISQIKGIVEVDVNDLFEDSLPGKTNKRLGGIYTYSAGTTGYPHISLTDVFGFTRRDLKKQRAMISKKMNMDKTSKVFYSAPLMSGATVYISMIMLGLKVYLTNGIPQTKAIQEILNKHGIDVCTGRPSIIERFMQEEQKLGGIKTFISAGAPLNKTHVDFINSIGAERIVDFYSTTEAGLIGIREATIEEAFEIFPGVKIKNTTDKFFTINSKFCYEKNNIKIDDRIVVKGNKIKTLERPVKKIKSNGFSVSINVLKTAVIDFPGISDAKISGCRFEGKDAVKLEYTGEYVDEEELNKFLSKRLPFYSIPRVTNFIESSEWGLGK